MREIFKCDNFSARKRERDEGREEKAGDKKLMGFSGNVVRDEIGLGARKFENQYFRGGKSSSEVDPWIIFSMFRLLF